MQFCVRRIYCLCYAYFIHIRYSHEYSVFILYILNVYKTYKEHP